MNISIRFSTGCYDFCHPQEKQDLAHIELPCLEKALTLTVKEGKFDDLKNQDWSEAIPEALERYIHHILYSTDLDNAKKALEWCKVEENLDAIQKVWVELELKLVRRGIENLEQKRLKLIKIQEALI